MVALSILAGVEGVIEPEVANAAPMEATRSAAALPEGLAVPEPKKRSATPATKTASAATKTNNVVKSTVVKTAPKVTKGALAKNVQDFDGEFQIKLNGPVTKPAATAATKNGPAPLPSVSKDVKRQTFDESTFEAVRSEAKKGQKAGVRGLAKAPTPVYAAAATQN